MEIYIRLGSFIGVLLVVATWEWLLPRRKLSFSRFKRWPHNLGIVALNAILLRLLFPILAIGVVIIAKQNNWGLLNNGTVAI